MSNSYAVDGLLEGWNVENGNPLVSYWRLS